MFVAHSIILVAGVDLEATVAQVAGFMGRVVGAWLLGLGPDRVTSLTSHRRSFVSINVLIKIVIKFPRTCGTMMLPSASVFFRFSVHNVRSLHSQEPSGNSLAGVALCIAFTGAFQLIDASGIWLGVIGSCPGSSGGGRLGGGGGMGVLRVW
ncbi:hypothetical protein CROQUDRAFT_101959 [Cronartium quercuum f. sp. fusiforme G11]|uniref:Uncharacterized protein n=1 Tax=Cronartium quercuum f. sp. fusiforme G11 TaxID=708437 RepID=A0A9P6N7P0_9BASI|nr:hypothetical protein CROQUDRAFT_101959 [Cronartium quercuum f. sp. fusiforme G11]